MMQAMNVEIRTAPDARGLALCDFCSEEVPFTELTPHGCDDFARSMILRDGTVLVETCECHLPIPRKPGDVVFATQVCVGRWGACKVCEPYVAAGDQTGLARVAAECATGREVGPLHGTVVTVGVSGTAMGIEERDTIGIYASMHAAYWLHRRERG